MPQLLSEESEPARRNKIVDHLYSKYNLTFTSFTRRSESRSSIQSCPSVLSVSHSLPTTAALIVKMKEVPILKKGAEGRLLVPDAKLKVSTSHANVSGSPVSSRITRRTSGFSDGSIHRGDGLAIRPRPAHLLFSAFRTRRVASSDCGGHISARMVI